MTTETGIKELDQLSRKELCELRALVERVAELEAKLSAYENAPTIGVIRDVGSRPYCDWKVSQSTLPKSGAEIIARPTFKDKP